MYLEVPLRPAAFHPFNSDPHLPLLALTLLEHLLHNLLLFN